MMYNLLRKGAQGLAFLGLMLALAIFTPSTNNAVAIAALPSSFSPVTLKFTALQVSPTSPLLLSKSTASSGRLLATVNKNALRKAALQQNNPARKKVKRQPSQLTGSPANLANNKGALKKAARVQSSAKQKISERQLKASKIVQPQTLKPKAPKPQPQAAKTQPKVPKPQPQAAKAQPNPQQPKVQPVVQTQQSPVQKVENSQDSTPNTGTASKQNPENRILKINKIFGK